MTEEESTTTRDLIAASEALHRQHLAYERSLEDLLERTQGLLADAFLLLVLSSAGWLGLLLNALFLRSAALSIALAVYFVAVALYWHMRSRRHGGIGRAP